MARIVEMTFVDQTSLEREARDNLEKNRTFVAGTTDVEVGDICELSLCHPVTGARHRLVAESVWVVADGDGRGVGFEIRELDVEALRAFVEGRSGELDEPELPPGIEPLGEGEDVGLPPGVALIDDQDVGLPPGVALIDDDTVAESLPTGTATLRESGAEDEGVMEPEGVEVAVHSQSAPSEAPRSSGRAGKNVQERIRGLSMREQVVVARSGSLTERIALERTYGSSVWENLLQNPQLTPPEVARISKKGNLPKPLLGVICGNRSWLASPEVQRALLANPRLDGANLTKVLRALSRHDLQKVPQQTAYRFAVRDAAKRMLR